MKIACPVVIACHRLESFYKSEDHVCSQCDDFQDDTHSRNSLCPIFHSGFLQQTDGKGLEQLQKEHRDTNLNDVCVYSYRGSEQGKRYFYLCFRKETDVNNVSSTNLEQSKLCVNSPLYIDTRLFWEQAIGCNSA